MAHFKVAPLKSSRKAQPHWHRWKGAAMLGPHGEPRFGFWLNQAWRHMPITLADWEVAEWWDPVRNTYLSPSLPCALAHSLSFLRKNRRKSQVPLTANKRVCQYPKLIFSLLINKTHCIHNAHNLRNAHNLLSSLWITSYGTLVIWFAYTYALYLVLPSKYKPLQNANLSSFREGWN